MSTSVLPDSAPFTEEQRAWLNGFLSGLMGIDETADSDSENVSTGPQEEDLDDAPWHDDSLPIVERMEMAEGKPLSHQLMAAMAQLDCGSCGYLCQSYSAAIAKGEETNLTLCSPGGKETKQALKQLVKEIQLPGQKKESSNGSAVSLSGSTESAISRKNPFKAKLVESRCLNKEGSAKDTRHVVIDLAGSSLQYKVGDALGIVPTNCPDLADQIIDRLAVDPNLSVEIADGSRKPFRDALIDNYCLKEPTDELLDLLIDRAPPSDGRAELQTYLADGVSDGIDVLDILQTAEVQVTVTELLETLEPLNPRLYSIASSMKAVGDSVHLTVGKVSYQRDGRERKGVASTMLADRLAVGDDVRVFIQPCHGGFTVPEDPSKPMIMVGPGTGIAPFIAFLQERKATSATGKNWLFFGDQHESTDFLYREDLQQYQADGLLNRIDTAFSRDSQQKVYVQNRMTEHGAELWSWIEQGGHFYVCGDASRMAKDVDTALHQVIQTHGNMSADDAKKYVKQMSADKRYVRDVY